LKDLSEVMTALTSIFSTRMKSFQIF